MVLSLKNTESRYSICYMFRPFVLCICAPEGRGGEKRGCVGSGEVNRFRNEILLSLVRATSCQHEETTNDVVMPTKAVPSTLVQRWYSPAGAPHVVDLK